MNALRLILKPIAHGWAVYLTDGREVARFRGPGSKRRALRYLADGGGDRVRPSSDVPSYWFIPSPSRPPQITR